MCMCTRKEMGEIMCMHKALGMLRMLTTTVKANGYDKLHVQVKLDS